MFEQDVAAEGKLELDVFACRGDVEVLGHDAPTLRVAADSPKTEYHVREQGRRFVVEASGPLRIDVPRTANLEVIAGQRKVSVHNMEGAFTITSAGDDRVLEDAGAAATAFAREFSDVGRRLGADFGRLGRDLGEQFGRTFGAWGRGDVGGRARRRGRGIDVEAFIRRAEEGAEKFARTAEDRAERFAQRAEERMRRAAHRADRAEERIRRSAEGAKADAGQGPASTGEDTASSTATVDEERRAVLNMLQEGKISAEQAEELLHALHR